MTGQRYSKGEWKAYESPFAPAIIIERTPTQARRLIAVCRLEQGSEGMAEATANAQLIVAAVNACAAVNPNDPKAAAESIAHMYKALNCWRDIYRTHVQKKPIEGKLDRAWKLTAQALGTAEEKEVQT